MPPLLPPPFCVLFSIRRCGAVVGRFTWRFSFSPHTCVLLSYHQGQLWAAQASSVDDDTVSRANGVANTTLSQSDMWQWQQCSEVSGGKGKERKRKGETYEEMLEWTVGGCCRACVCARVSLCICSRDCVHASMGEWVVGDPPALICTRR